MIRFLFFAVSCLLYHAVCGVNVVSKDSVASVEQDTVIENQIITDSIPESFLEKLDYYYTSWYTGKRDSTYYVDSLCIAESCKNIVPCNDSVYLLRWILYNLPFHCRSTILSVRTSNCIR